MYIYGLWYEYNVLCVYMISICMYSVKSPFIILAGLNGEHFRVLALNSKREKSLYCLDSFYFYSILVPLTVATKRACSTCLVSLDSPIGNDLQYCIFAVAKFTLF